MISIEDNMEWLGKYNSDYIHAPIKFYDDNWVAPNIPHNIGWYDPKVLQLYLKDKKYDMLLIDGPAGWVGAPGRAGFLKHLDLFNTNVPIIIDDVQREQERILLDQISKILNRPYTINEPDGGVDAPDYCAAGIIL
jgi:hypothetical protein